MTWPNCVFILRVKLTNTNVLLTAILGSVKANVEDAGSLRDLPVKSGNALHVCLAGINNQVTNLSVEVVLERISFTQAKTQILLQDIRIPD